MAEQTHGAVVSRGTSEIVWRPTPEVAARSCIGRFMARHGLASLEALQRRSVEDPEWFWDAVSRDLDFQWTRPYRRVLDASGGIAWPRWFEGGEINLAANCVDRHLTSPRRSKPALLWEAEDGQVRTLTYTELSQEVNRLANALRRLGIGTGDTVGLFLPMSPEAAVAALAIIRIGAIFTPCFSGYGAQAIATRLQDSGAKLLITADAFPRRGRVVPTKAVADEALAECPTVRNMLVVRRLGVEIPWTAARDHWWHEAVAGQSSEAPAEPGEADRPCLLIYTSGTTGRPKGAVLTQGGLGLKVASDVAYVFDVGEADTVFWLTDMGWLMGGWLILGSLLRGATALLFEGTPDYPGPDRLWALAAKHRVTVIGLSPTAVRSLMPHGSEPVRRHDLSTLRILGSTGEPWNPEPYLWLFDTVGRGRLPIINYTGGTENSGGILGCFLVAPIKPCSFAGPIPGMAARVFDEDGKPVRGQVGELVITRPWPGMTRGFWQDPTRYEQTYWSRWPGVWVHGDWAVIDADGFWFLHGRSDDTLKIAGKRVGPAEVESVLVGHPAVAEAGTIGVPHEVKGEAVICFVMVKPGQSPSQSLRAELTELVTRQMGKALRPERVLFVRDLPRTRSAKIMRRVIRAAHLGRDPGDLSSLENPEAVQAITSAE
ncbi:MAG: acetate--CoA ligase [Candidatus Methylomirabilia bacterium]